LTCLNHIAELTSTETGIENAIQYVYKTRKTEQLKDLPSVQAKANALRGAFEIMPDAPIQGKKIILLDDIYQSGTTLNEVANILKHKGAIVLGLVATKTIIDSD